MVKIVVLEKEPSGQYQEYPDIAIFDDSESKEKMQLTSLDRGLLEVASFHPFQAFYHRGGQTGAVISYISSKYYNFLNEVRCLEDYLNKQKSGDDELLNKSIKGADYVVWTLSFSRIDSDLVYEELDEYIQLIKEIAFKNHHISKKRKLELEEQDVIKKKKMLAFIDEIKIEDFFPESSVDSSTEDKDK